MTIDYKAALALSASGTASYDDTATMLYAISIGMGRDPYDPKELPFVYEGMGGLKAVPTMAAVLARNSLVGRLNINLPLMLHGEQRMTLHRPLPTQAAIAWEARVSEILDKGPGKGALIYMDTILRLEGESAPLVTIGQTLFARGDGGFGGPAGPTPQPHAMPDRAPDHRHVSETRLDQALLYRLNGDRNPLHADPALAKTAGFKAPILHGLCSYAIACRAVLAAVCDYDPARIASFDVRFTSPVYPGETVTTDIWVDGDVASFRCRIEDRDVVSINNGRCQLRTA